MGYATQEQAEAIFAAIKERDEDRERRLPSTRSALDAALTARERLTRLGWRDGIYCPKDGSTFALVQWGSTGVHSGHYVGEWPKGYIYSCDFVVQPEAVMWKALSALDDDERAAVAASDRDTAEFIDRLGRLESTP